VKVTLLSRAFLPNVGGIETSSAMMAEVWSDTGHEVEVVTATPDEHPWEGAYSVSRSWSLPILARKIAATDFVATNGYSRVAVVAAMLSRRPIVVFHQGYQLICSDGLGFRDRQFHGFRIADDLRLAFAAGGKVGLRALARLPLDGALRTRHSKIIHVVPSHHVAERLRLPQSTVLYQPPNPVVIAALEELGPQSTPAAAGSFEGGDIVFFGRLVFEKGCDVLVRAYASWISRGWPGLPVGRVHPRLVIYGRGPELTEIQTLTRQLAVEEMVDVRPFVGGRELVLAAREASVVVIPSVWEEPGATIAVELFACGVPVIVTATGAQGEIFKGHGRLVPNGDVAALADAIAQHFAAGPLRPQPAGTEPWALPAIKRSLLELLATAPGAGAVGAAA
jgi:glycosyltransferase involved in cell wall biosynthesis